MFQPAFFSASREDGIGPVPMILGSTPAWPHDTMRPSTFLPSLAACLAVISTTAAAPSLMPDALPAVTMASLSKAGLRLALESMVAPWRGYSSSPTMMSPLRGFLAAGDHDFGIAVEQRLIAERDRAQAGAAELVDAPGRAFYRNTGGDRGLAGRVLALGCGQNLAHDDFGDAAGLDARALQRGLDGDGAEVMGRGGGERAVETADRGAGGADDDDIV